MLCTIYLQLCVTCMFHLQIQIQNLEFVTITASFHLEVDGENNRL